MEMTNPPGELACLCPAHFCCAYVCQSLRKLPVCASHVFQVYLLTALLPLPALRFFASFFWDGKEVLSIMEVLDSALGALLMVGIWTQQTRMWPGLCMTGS